MNAFRQLDMERYLANRMGEHARDIFSGDTNPVSRKAAFRAAILDAGIGAQVLGRNAAGSTETLAEFWERTYGEPFHVEQLELT